MYSETEKEPSRWSSIRNRLFHRRTRRLFTDTEQEFERYLTAFGFISIAFILGGILFSIWPFMSFYVLQGTIVGLGIISGFLCFWFFRKRKSFSFYQISILYGILNIIVSILGFFFQGYSILVVLALYILITILERIFTIFYFLRLHDRSVMILIVSSCLMLFMAVLLFINPFAQLYFGEVLGIFMVLYGILNLLQISFLQKRSRDFLTLFD